MLRMFGSKREEVTGDRDKPHNQEFHICGYHNLFELSNREQ